MEFFANRGFAVTNAVSLAMYFGMFGSIFFLSQFLQNVLHNTPLQAGVKLLVWTGAVMVVSPGRGLPVRALRQPAVHGRRASACRPIALGMLAMLASVRSDLREHGDPVRAGRERDGAGVRAVGQRGSVLGRGPRRRARPRARPTRSVSSAACSGIAVLATVFTSHGSYASPQAYVAGLTPAMWVGAAVLAAGALIALVLPFSTRASAADAGRRRGAATDRRRRRASSPDAALGSGLTTMATTPSTARRHPVSASRRPSAGTR